MTLKTIFFCCKKTHIKGYACDQKERVRSPAVPGIRYWPACGPKPTPVQLVENVALRARHENTAGSIVSGDYRIRFHLLIYALMHIMIYTCEQNPSLSRHIIR